jgi:hypothetical protein
MISIDPYQFAPIPEARTPLDTVLPDRRATLVEEQTLRAHLRGVIGDLDRRIRVRQPPAGSR